MSRWCHTDCFTDLFATFLDLSRPVWTFLLTQCISVWYGNSSNQDCKALQRVVRLAERISGSALPSLQDIYLKRYKSRAAKIIKDSTHPGNHLFSLLPSGKRFRSMMAKTERLRRSFFPQAIRLLNTNCFINTLKKKKKKKHSYSHHPYCYYVYIPSTTRLHIPLIPLVYITIY